MHINNFKKCIGKIIHYYNINDVINEYNFNCHPNTSAVETSSNI